MQLTYTERTEIVRTYTMEVDIEELCDFADGRPITESLIDSFISLDDAELSENEYTLETGYEERELDAIVEACEDYQRSECEE